jgi:ATP-dependent Zn protease
VEEYREQFLNELLMERDGFVYRNEELILNSLKRDTGLIVIDEPQTVATTV